MILVADRRFAREVAKLLDAGETAPRAAAEAASHVLRHIEHVTLEGRDLYDASRGLVTNVTRLAERAKWFRDAVPHPLDQQIVYEVLFFARGGDRFDGGAIPAERMADKLGLDVGEFVVRMTIALETLREVRAEWVATNIDNLLSQRLCEVDDLAEWEDSQGWWEDDGSAA